MPGNCSAWDQSDDGQCAAGSMTIRLALDRQKER
jgi:hypothetical protein